MRVPAPIAVTPATPGQGAVGESTRFVSILPTSGPPGTTVEVTGTGFAPNRYVAVAVGREAIAYEEVATVGTGPRGMFKYPVTIPRTAEVGQQWVVAVSPLDSIFKAVSNDFTVTDATIPDITVPDITVPDVTVPDVTVPDVTVPEPTVLEPTVPEVTAPEATPATSVQEPLVIVPESVSATTPADPWGVAYFNNPNLVGLPVVTTQVQAVDLDWDYGAPVPQVSPEGFSGRFEQTVELEEGFYALHAQADDGIRVFVNDELVIDEWHLGEPTPYRAGRWLSGLTRFEIEYYEAGGQASVFFDYEQIDEFPVWRAAYFANISLEGQPAWLQPEDTGVDAELSHQWSLASPVPGVIPEDNWSGRWTGDFWFEAGDYVLRAEANDGVRVWLDDVLAIDRWRDGPHEVEIVFSAVEAGQHTVRVEYYERGGVANLGVSWDRVVP